ncbi:putative prephenate dehydrogenase [Gordonia namibiensis NBRC 108229]|uniref:Putative prephenate dehydrogenase n=1 Tax=Gordonia namibiensis NBRC 108229 TaxID=1208314 RepID=K6XJ18_9ACTN|nr:prephenate dehydrogenase dimerization domain-containing protein [Gordonia namibiensis]GAB98804.1 putative prephenate dehydrogenase [Gordonia namibiensis NBRC 108229]
MTSSPTPGARSVVVAGGAGAVGTMLADLWRGDGDTVHVLDARGGDDIRSPGPEAAALLGEADVVVLAVPEDVALAAVKAVSTLLRPTALLLETLSVKSRFSSAVAELAGDDVDGSGPIVGINPMFAPSLGLSSRTVAVVVHRDGPGADRLRDDLARWGARVEMTTADRHDHVCAAVQALTHAAILAFGYALADLGVDADEAAALATPPFTTMSALLARITGGTPEVYRDVQASNPCAPAAREALARAVSRVSDASAGDTEDFATLLTEAGESLGSHADDYARLCAQMFEGLSR